MQSNGNNKTEETPGNNSNGFLGASSGFMNANQAQGTVAPNFPEPVGQNDSKFTFGVGNDGNMGARRDEFKSGLRKQKLDEMFSKRRGLSFINQSQYNLTESKLPSSFLIILFFHSYSFVLFLSLFLWTAMALVPLPLLSPC